MKRAKSFVQTLGADLPSSIVVFLVALPLCLGVALASNAPLFSGLIAGMVGGMVVGALSGSQLSVSGPAAGLTAIVAVAILKLPSFEAFLLSVVICGLLQVALGFARAGVLGDYVPNSVIKGMLAAIGLILIINQLPHLIGYMATDQNQGLLSYITPAAAVIGITGIFFQVLWEKMTGGKKGLTRLIPAPLVVVLLGIGIHQFFAGRGATLSATQLVSLPVADDPAAFFSFFTLPDWSALTHREVWITGITLALVASLETLLSIEAVDDLDPYQRVTDKDRELKAQGVGNLVSGLVGGLPVTSVIVRSSANVNAGARSKMSTIMHGALLLLCVALLPGFLNLIPNAALAAVLIYTGYKLAKPALFRTFYQKGWNQFLPFVITIVAILLTDLLIGVVIGIGIGLLFILRSNFKSSVYVVNDQNRFLFRLRKDVSFMNKPIIKNKLEQVPENGSVLIDASRADFIDTDIVEVIEDFMLHAPLKNIKVDLKLNGKTHGFDKVPALTDGKPNLIRKHEKTLAAVEHQS